MLYNKVMLNSQSMLTFKSNPKTDWEQYLGNIYCGLFEKLDIERYGTIIEVAPGYMGSIGHGLAKYDFGGVLYIIEPSPHALKSSLKKYKSLLPKANIIGVPSLLEDVITNSKVKDFFIDLVVSNHSLDDIIIGKLLTQRGEFKAFFTKNHASYSIKNAKTTSISWRNLINNYSLLFRLINETIDEWKHIIAKSNAVILSAYNSHFHSLYSDQYPSIRYADKIAQLTLNILKKTLKNHTFVNLSDGEVIHSKEYWLCATKNKIL